MANGKRIELNFADDDVIVIDDSPAKAEMTVKKLNFGGLVIEVLEPKAKKIARKTIDLNLSANENSAASANGCIPKAIEPPKTEQPETDQVKPQEPQKMPVPSVAPQKDENLVIELMEPKTKKVGKTINLSFEVLNGNSAPRVQESEQPIQDVNQPAQDKINGAAGLWALDKEEVTDHATASTNEDSWNVVKKVIVPEVKNEMSHYDRLLELSKSLLLKNQEDFVCSICEGFVFKGEGIMLKGCLHNACKICLVDEIQTNFDMMGQVKCPFRGFPCDQIIDDDEVKELLGDGCSDFYLKVNQALDAKLRESERPSEESKHDFLPILLDADNHDYIENYEKFECAVCFTETEIGDGVILKNCLHKFCKLCIIGQVEHSEDFEVKCPFNDGTDNCEFKLQEREIRGLVTAEVFDKHLEKSLKLYEAANSSKNFHCMTANCRGFYELMDANVRGFTCEVCLIVNCIGCKAIHQGKNCQQYQDEINPNAKNLRENAESENAIKNMIAGDQAMWCPRCGIPVMKDEGCDYITCTACKLGICWRTKKPRHPITKENGLIIDGCHCKENGVACHPQCGNCH